MKDNYLGVGSMCEKVLEEFGIQLMTDVRDRSISNWDKILNGRIKGISAQMVKEKVGNFNDEQLETLKWIIPKIVDESLHNLLFMLEECKHINVDVASKDENGNIRELSDGLAGGLYTEDGWIRRFSKERYEEI